jgi:hypothetical protein
MSTFDQALEGHKYNRMEVGLRAVERTYSFQVPMYYVDRMEILEPLCHLVELETERRISEPPAEFEGGDDTKWVRETCGWDSKCWMIFPESAQS